MDHKAPAQYAFMLTLCYKPECSHPLCHGATREQCWFENGPPLSHIPFLIPDPKRPWGGSCQECSGMCSGHYLKPLAHWAFVKDRAYDTAEFQYKPPSAVFKERFYDSLKKGKEMLHIDLESVAKQVLLSVVDVSMQVEHLKGIMERRKMGAQKAAALTRKNKKAVHVPMSLSQTSLSQTSLSQMMSWIEYKRCIVPIEAFRKMFINLFPNVSDRTIANHIKKYFDKHFEIFVNCFSQLYQMNSSFSTLLLARLCDQLWFHTQCMGLKQPPRGSWFCTNSNKNAHMVSVPSIFQFCHFDALPLITCTKTFSLWESFVTNAKRSSDIVYSKSARESDRVHSLRFVCTFHVLPGLDHEFIFYPINIPVYMTWLMRPLIIKNDQTRFFIKLWKFEKKTPKCLGPSWGSGFRLTNQYINNINIIQATQILSDFSVFLQEKVLLQQDLFDFFPVSGLACSYGKIFIPPTYDLGKFKQDLGKKIDRRRDHRNCSFLKLKVLINTSFSDLHIFLVFCVTQLYSNCSFLKLEVLINTSFSNLHIFLLYDFVKATLLTYFWWIFYALGILIININAQQTILNYKRIRGTQNVRKEMQKVLPGFAFKKSVERLRKGIKKVLQKDELVNKDVADAVSFIETKTMKKRGSLIKFNDVRIFKLHLVAELEIVSIHVCKGSPSSKPKNLFEDKTVQFKLVVLGTPDDVLQTFVS
ncbi:Hypothetical predicted protein, partial [Paramuricea clavata]